MRIEQHAGDRFGHYVLIAYAKSDRRGQCWRVRCDCGSETVLSVAGMRLRVKKGEDVQCRACGSRQRLANGGARRSGQVAAAKRLGDARAFQGEWFNFDEELP